jgi:hypothetical protein
MNGLVMNDTALTRPAKASNPAFVPMHVAVCRDVVAGWSRRRRTRGASFIEILHVKS